jgi:ABC-type branched-subunit amino acid transport system substrate-binding protein
MPRLSLALLIAPSVLLLAFDTSCSATFQPKVCATDSDCGGDLVCIQNGSSSVCTAPTSAPIRIGMGVPLSGPSQDLGTEMKKGVQLAFDNQNAAGGVHGRHLDLVVRDDQYDPTSAEAAARDLLDVQVAPPGVPPKCPTTADNPPTQPPVSTTALSRGPNGVLALLGNVGTPTMVRTAPIAVETGTLFFGAFTGSAKMLRDGTAQACARYIFNVRASYAQEARATMEFYLKQGVPDWTHVLSFDQNDTFGDAGYNGMIAAYTALKGAPAGQDPKAYLKRFRYIRDDLSSVPAQVTAATQYLASLLQQDSATHHVGIMMTDTYGPATGFITGVRNWQYANDAEQGATSKATRLNIVFSNVSFSGPNSLAKRLVDAGTVQTPSGPKAFTDGVFVSQVVPNYQSDSSDVVRDFRGALDAAHLTPSFTSLEGYLAARVFIAGLLGSTGELNADSLIASFERLPNLALGLGANSGFSATSHNYSKSVWGTAISPDGSFTNRYFWTDGTPLQLFE